MIEPDDDARPTSFGLSDRMLDSMCGAILGMFDGGKVPPMAGVLVCAAVIGEGLSEMPEPVREEALRAVLTTARGIAQWHKAGPPATARPQ